MSVSESFLSWYETKQTQCANRITRCRGCWTVRTSCQLRMVLLLARLNVPRHQPDLMLMRALMNQSFLTFTKLTSPFSLVHVSASSSASFLGNVSALSLPPRSYPLASRWNSSDDELFSNGSPRTTRLRRAS
jgi:hypothetical protein